MKTVDRAELKDHPKDAQYVQLNESYTYKVEFSVLYENFDNEGWVPSSLTVGDMLDIIVEDDLARIIN